MLMSKTKGLAGVAALAVVGALVSYKLAHSDMPTSRGAEAALSKTVHDVAKRWPKLDHVPAKSVADKLGRDDLVLIDARSTDEFAVSHLKGAEYVAPETTAAEFLKRFGDRVAGKDVVFYCAVGVRSSTLATRVASGLKDKGARSVVNMAGGIFAWHNQRRPLVNASGPTESVHSYDQWWGRMVSRPEHIQNAPKAP